MHVTNEQMNKVWSIDGSRLEPNATAYPCGILAKSMFNDTFALYTSNPNETDFETDKIKLNSTDITWNHDR